jgi:hypothetical protein
MVGLIIELLVCWGSAVYIIIEAQSVDDSALQLFMVLIAIVIAMMPILREQRR